MPQITLTQAILESLRTPSGGYSRNTLMLIGVGWPPYKKWKKKLVGTTIDSKLLALAERNSIPVVSDDVLYQPPKLSGEFSIKYPEQDSKFEIQSFLHSSLKPISDIRGEIYSGFDTLDLVIFDSNVPLMIINILREGEVPIQHRLPTRIIRTMVEAKELVAELTMKKLGLH